MSTRSPGLPLLRHLLVLAAMTLPPALSAAGRAGEDAVPVRPLAPPSGAALARSLGGDGLYRMNASFRSFAGEPLRLSFTLARADSERAMREFGASVPEVASLVESCIHNPKCDPARETARYYREHGLRIRQERGQRATLSVDVPLAVQRNLERVAPLADALRRLTAERGENRIWAMEAAVALVQTSLAYRQPETWENGRKIVGFYPPPRALEQGYGDCDTKSALLAALLMHLTDAKVIGVHVPEHYLLGIAGKPGPGQAFLKHEGVTYVLIEAAGPALRPPGDVSPTTAAALRKRKGLRIDPIA